MRIGIDLGGTNIAAGLVDKNLNIVKRGSVPTPRGDQAVADEMEKLARALLNGSGLQDVESVGVGFPGAIDAARGVVVYSNNLDIYNLPIAQMLSARLGGVPVRIGNDANAAALGEFSVLSGIKSMILITLGTGV